MFFLLCTQLFCTVRFCLTQLRTYTDALDSDASSPIGTRAGNNYISLAAGAPGISKAIVVSEQSFEAKASRAKNPMVAADGRCGAAEKRFLSRKG